MTVTSVSAKRGHYIVVKRLKSHQIRVKNNVNVIQDSRKSLRNCARRSSPQTSQHNRDRLCIICNCKSHQGLYEKYRISKTSRAKRFLKATIYFQDNTKTSVSAVTKTNFVNPCTAAFCAWTIIRKSASSSQKQSRSETMLCWLFTMQVHDCMISCDDPEKVLKTCFVVVGLSISIVVK